MRVSQNSFVAGELDPALYGRQDLQKYFNGAARLSNFVVQRHGGVTKRQGTDLVFDLSTIANVGASNEGVRIVPFLYDRSNAYLLAFVDRRVYFFSNAQPVFFELKPGDMYYVDSPYDFEALPDIRVSQSGDTLFITHPDYAPAKLVRNGHADWALTTISFDILVSAPENVVVAVSPTQTGSKITHSYVVSVVKDGQESRVSIKSDVSITTPWPSGTFVTIDWDKVDGAQEYRVYKRVYGSYGLIGSTSALGMSGAVVKWTTSATLSSYYQNNLIDNLSDGIVDEKTGTPEYHSSYAILRQGSGQPTIKKDLGSAKTIVGVRIAWGAIALKTGGGVVAVESGSYQFKVDYSDDGINWREAKRWVNNPHIITTGKITYVFTGSTHRYWSVYFWDFRVQTLETCVREVDLIDANDENHFVDVNIDPDTSMSPTDSADPWIENADYPAVMSLFQQRSVWAGSVSRVARVLFSATGNLYTFNKSFAPRPDDQIDVTLALTQPGAIRHLVPLRNLLLLTESGEWSISYNETSGLAFDTLRANQISHYGCNKVVPIQTGASVLFVRRDGRGAYEYQYQLENDGFQGMDRSILSAHLTENAQIVEWAYQRSPDSVVWAVLDDGSMIAMTYMPEHEIWAWSRHSLSGGLVKQAVASGALIQQDDGDATWSDTNTDEVYLVVARGDQLMLERMRVVQASDAPSCGQAVCMDCVQRVELGEESTSFELPESLPDGAVTVVNLVTGVAQTGAIASGVCTVATAVRYCLVGYAITSELHTLRPEVPQSASLQAYRKTIKKATLRLRRFAGGSVGALGATTDPVDLPDSTPTITESEEGAPDCTVALRTGDRALPVFGMWNRDGQMQVVHDDVWPFSLLCVISEIEVEGAK